MNSLDFKNNGLSSSGGNNVKDFGEKWKQIERTEIAERWDQKHFAQQSQVWEETSNRRDIWDRLSYENRHW